MVRTQIQLTEEQIRDLKNLAAERNVSLAELIRNSVDNFIRSSKGISLSERRKRAIAISGRFTSIQPGANVSEDHDEYLVESYLS